MTYPIVTKENFEEIFKKHVVCKGQTYFFKGLPVPKTREDFFLMTKNMFGVGLGVSGHYNQYKIEAVESLYSKLDIPRLWNGKLGQYEGLKTFLCFTFNEVSCGGVAGSHYGQFYSKGHRHELRLRRFWQSKFVPSEDFVQNHNS